MRKLRKVVSGMLAVMLCIGMIPARAHAQEVLDDENMVQLQVNTIEELTLHPGDRGVFCTSYNGMARTIGLDECTITMAYLEDTELDTTYLHMEFGTSSTHDAAQIGVRDIKVQKKYGIFWMNIAHADGGYDENTSEYNAECDCYNVEQGETYRVSCEHYAEIQGNTYSYHATTPGVPFS